MKMSISKLLFIHLCIIATLLSTTVCQSQCHLSRFPEVIPMLYGQQATVNLQQYVTGTNITFTVEPNDFYANILPQYSCKWLWNRQLGKILATEYYEVRQNNQTEKFVAMLGGSVYFDDVYLVYYGISASGVNRSEEISREKKQFVDIGDFSSSLSDSFQVLQVPRSLLKSCKSFNILSNSTHLQFIIDCLSLNNPLTKILTSTTIPLSTSPPSPIWNHIQSPIYLPIDIIPKLQTLRSQISAIDLGKGVKYLLRTVMSEYQDYIEVWRWIQGGKEIVGLYDYTFFVEQEDFPGEDIDIRMVQVVSNTFLILDLINGLHIVRLNKQGQLLYTSTLQLDAFTSFHYDPKQLLLFMGKRGQVQQYQISLLSQSNIKATRIQRYHLYGFEEIQQIATQNRFLYVSTQKYIHVVHLTNILSNNQQYDGSYKVYPELYVQKLIPTDVGFVKVVGFQSIVQISICETHPPFLHLKAPKMSTNFTVHAISTINHQSTQCSMPLSSVMVTADDDKIYLNGYEAENQTIFSNRPGRTLVDLDKYGIGKNLDYELVTFNHKIPFEHKFRKTSIMACEFVKSSLIEQKEKQTQNQKYLQNQQFFTATPIVKTSSIGTWLIAQYPQKRVKQYYKCFKYQKIQCKFMHLSIVPTNSPLSAYQLIEEERTKKEYLHEAISYQLVNQTIIEVSLISGNGTKNLTVSEDGQQNEENLKTQSLLCKVKYPPGAQYEVSQFQLREDKLYVVLPHLKQIRIYEALLSFQQDMACHYFGTISLQSFNHPKIYFSPQHIDFDKQALNLPYLVPSSNYFSYKNYKLIVESTQVMFISQFSEILVVRVTIGRDTISRVDLLKSVMIDRLREGDEISLMATLPYVLAIDRQQKVIAQYYFTHTFDTYFIRMLDFYPDNTTLLNNVRLVDSNTLAVMTAPDAQNQSHVQVYLLNSIVSSFKEFARWKVSGTFLVMQFLDDEYQFITTTFQQSATSLQMYCNSTTLTPSPILSIDVPKRNNSDQPSKEQFYLRITTDSESKKHVMTLQVASDSSDILKGTDYPYRTLRIKLEQDQQELYVEINDMKWFQGNIWTQRYVCNDCKTGRIRFEDKVALQRTIELQAFNIPNDFYVQKRNSSTDQLGQYSFEIIEGYLHTKLTPQDQNQTWLPSQFLPQYDIQASTHNFTYTFSESTLLSSNTQNNPSCIKASPTGHSTYFASLCDDYQYLDDSAVLQLRLYSNHGSKPFVINEYFIEIGLLNHQSRQSLRAGTKTSKQLIILSPPQPAEDDPTPKYDTLFVRFDDNIWVFLVINGRLELIYTVDKVDFGGDHLCWMEVTQNLVNLEENNNQLQYGIAASMCETGLYYIVFSVDEAKSTVTSGLSTEKQPLPSFHRLSEQNIDMQSLLQKNKIQLPQHSYFLQTIIKPSSQPHSFYLYTIVQNFNSFIWKVTLLRETIAISSIELMGVIRRYNEYSPIQVTSSDERYFSVLYKSTLSVNVTEFLALYDLEHFVLNKEKDVREYNMFAVQETRNEPVYDNKSEVFQIGTSLFLLNQNQIKIFNVTNMIRMHVQKNFPLMNLNQQHSQSKKQTNLLTDDSIPILYSQSIIIFVQTPTQVNSATIKLDSVDFFELSDWEIVFIVVGGLVALIILYYVSKQIWKFVQKRRKLVRLETDSMDDRSSEKVSEQGRQSKDDEQGEDAMEQQEQQPPMNIYDRDSQITTSDSHSILQRDHTQQPLIPNRQSQITTSDFSNSILQRKDLKQPLLNEQK